MMSEGEEEEVPGIGQGYTMQQICQSMTQAAFDQSINIGQTEPALTR